MNNLELLARVPAPLLAWYDKEARDLPWRQNTDPYRVWVSEIMLQQTRVEAVIPYYERFLAAFPDLKALADAPEEQLLKLWEGLGYYSRARNLQKAAREALSRFGGLPGQVQELSSLPGIGAYTAGAIASIAFSRPVPAVDGNVLRVVARLTDSHDDVLSPAVKREAEKAVAAVIPHDRPGDFNQAVMDLGATVCLPNGAPRCEVCPLAELCLGLARSTAPELPVKTKKKERQKLRTTSKTIVFVILAVCLVDLQHTYILAYLGREQIAEALSQDIVTTIIAVALGYFAKSFLETFAEKREERINRMIDNTAEPEQEVIE